MVVCIGGSGWRWLLCELAYAYSAVLSRVSAPVYALLAVASLSLRLVVYVSDNNCHQQLGHYRLGMA